MVTVRERKQMKKAPVDLGDFLAGAKITKRDREIQSAHDDGFIEGQRTAEMRLRHEMDQIKSDERKRILDTKIRVFDAVGQAIQQMSNAIDSAAHMIQEVK